MRLFDFPRRRYTQSPTALECATRLSAFLGGPEIWMKRDDLLGLAGGGNKTRKLEFLVADALLKGADTLITAGAVQSNHCRLTAAAAAREGLKCRLVLEQVVPDSYRPNAGGNNLLFDLLGVEAINLASRGDDLDALMRAQARALAGEGRSAYVLPVGGSNALGALGYVACAQELVGQFFDLGLKPDRVICASASAGTHAGLVAGFHGMRASVPVTGVSVSKPRAEQRALVHQVSQEIAALLTLSDAPPLEAISVYDEFIGPGYALASPEMIEAVRLTARLEGILLDPVYTGKAMAGLIGLVRQGVVKKHERVVFMHTGGAPSLSAFKDVFLGAPS